MKKNIFFTAALLAGFAASAQTFKVTRDEQVDITKFDRFTVKHGEYMTPKDQRKISDETVFNRVKNAIITDLQTKGYKYVEDSTDQFVFRYVVGSFEITDSGNVGPLGETPASTGAGIDQSRSWSRDAMEGVLELDADDSQSKKEIWKSTGTIRMDVADVKQLDGAIYQALKKFPKKKKR